MADCSGTQSRVICSSNATDIDARVHLEIKLDKNVRSLPILSSDHGGFGSNSLNPEKMDEFAEVDSKTCYTDIEITKAAEKLFLNEEIPIAASCDVEANILEKNSNMESSEAVTSVGVVAGERQGYYLNDDFTRKFDCGPVDFSSAIQIGDNVPLYKEMEYSTAIHEDVVKDGDNSAESSPSPCLNAFTFELDVQESHPHAATRGPLEALEIVSCTFGTDLAKPQCPFNAPAIGHAISPVFMSENDLLLPEVSAVPATEVTEAIDQTKLIVNSKVDNGETEVDLANVVECEEDYAWSCSSVTTEPTNFFLELKSPSDDDIRIKKSQELGISINSSILGFGLLDIDSGDLGTAFDLCPHQMNKQNLNECIVGNGSEHPRAEADLPFEDGEKENNFIKEPLEELDHQCFQIKNVGGSPSDEFDQQEVLEDRSKELTVSHVSEGLPETKAQISHFITEDKHVDLSCEEIKLNDLDEGVSYHQTAEEFFLGQDTPVLEGTSACAPRYATLKDSKTNCSVDSTNQEDSIEGDRGSISERTVPSAKHITDELPAPETETLVVMNNLHPSSIEKKGAEAETDCMDIFEAPSFVTLVEPGMQRAQPMQKKQLTRSSPSVPQIINESPERKSEEIIAKVVGWSPQRPPVPLKTLLDEANRDSRRRMLLARDRSLSSTGTMPQISRRTSAEPTSTLATKYYKEYFVGVDEKVWNSPARFPMVRKRRSKGRFLPWRPFICCPSPKESIYH
ncbi:hypothetical protein J5N97_022035 [Dioscorea zingiberensis]|uniref:Uncharacterized protein n=1 Tax=Dioscorea zingiberensis TaxID=325984 RepID=A0A9D5CAE9_9LILI|nr:hypothetical protein J5N97_022035 [Dioscorea zingiberensis]